MNEGSAQYFANLEKKLLEKYGKWPSFRAKICDRTVELRFPEETMRSAATRSLHGFVTDEPGTPDSVFYYWNDDFEPFMPEHPLREGADAPAISAFPPRMSAVDPDKRRFYYTQTKPSGADYMVHGRTTVFQFSRWASASDLLMLHAATVGIDGNGVLIAGRSGSGKTTFALSCLFAGMDFVSDDYTLLSASGPLRAMPLYTMVGVTPEMCDRFPQLQEISVLPPKDLPNGKRQFILPVQRLSKQLNIKAIVLPVIQGDAEPGIHRTSPGRAMVHLLHSSALQTGREHDTALIRQMGQRLAGLPVYEMHMSPELEKNPAALRAFIQKTF